MALASGSRLGAYEIRSLLGEGGMGQVYLARDTRLQRDVAIKVLPDSLAGDPDRLMRFEREAQTLAALNHPNIAHIHGVEESGPTRALVMEFVPGESLDVRLTRGPVPIAEALDIAKQLVEALDTAHTAGIVHRDLKPANIRVTPDGVTKVLDFGLARGGTADAARSGDLSPTITSPAMTAAGIILGTAAYMSPEQAKGRVVDKRADIWAFGVVLYEMLTGGRAFNGEDVSDLLVAVLSTDVDWAALPPSTPRAIRDLLHRCLERDPKRRLRDIGDARPALDEAPAAIDAAAAPEGPSRALALGWLGITLVVATGAAWLGYRASPRSEPSTASQHFAIQLSTSQDLVTNSTAVFEFSPDGLSVVFTARQDGRQSLFHRKLNEVQAVPIPGTEGATAAFFSPDGRWIGFGAEGQLKKVPVDGGRPFPLAEVRGAGGAVWLGNGTIVFAPIYSDGLFRVHADGGTPERLTTPDRASGELGHWWPQALPGGRQVVFTAFRTPVDRSRIGVLDLSTGHVEWVVDGGFFGRYVSTGHLVYAKEKRLYAMLFDVGAARPTGAAVPVLDDVLVSQTGGFAAIAVSTAGTLGYIRESVGEPPHELVWLDRSGRPTPATSERRNFRTVTLSPDGRTAALTLLEQSRDLWTLSFERGILSRLTSGAATEFDPKWSHDGRQLFYVLDRPPFDLYRMTVGSQEAGRPLWDEPASLDTVNLAVAPDNATIAFVRQAAGTGNDLFARAIDGKSPPRVIRATASQERYGTFSPDGRFVAYQDDETGRPEIYVQSFPEARERLQISSDGGTHPVWVRNGEIFYRRDNEVRVVATKPAGRFTFAPPRTLFTFPIDFGDDDVRTFDVTADGSRVLALTTPEANRPRQIDIITNWASELRRLVPATPR